MGLITLCALLHTKHEFFFSRRGSLWIKLWIFCTPVLVVRRIHHLTWGKPGLVRKLLPIDQLVHHLQTEVTACILGTRSCFFKAWNAVALHGSSCNNFVALHVDGSQTLISWTSCWFSWWRFKCSTSIVQLLFCQHSSFPVWFLSSSGSVLGVLTSLCIQGAVN